MLFKKGEEATAAYFNRIQNRTKTLGTATMNFVAYFMSLGDDQETAEGKVSQLSTEVAQYTHIYTLGNTQPLIDSINASNLAFMDAAAKTKITTDLTIQ